MFDTNLIAGEPVELKDMLKAREYRQQLQQDLISRGQVPLISFTMNIAGPVKVFPLAIMTWQEGIRLIGDYCIKEGWEIMNLTEVKEKTGYEALFSVPADPKKLKHMAVSLEDLPALGRIFDIDIIQTDGTKVSRTELGLPERKCLICEQQAFVCSRSRSHTVTELLERTYHIMQEYFKQTAESQNRL